MIKRIFKIASLLVVFLLVTLMAGNATTSPVYGQQGDPPGLERAKEVQERNTDRLMANPDVVGTAVGLNPGGQAAVMILTKKPGVGGLPNQLEGVPVVIRVTGEIFALCHNGGNDKKGCDGGGGGGGDPTPSGECTSRTGHYRPACIGISTGHPAVTAGTIGARVKDGQGNVFALSNNHVYADENQASIGDAVIQPGTYDGGSSPADNIGTLSAFAPIVFSTSANNVVDAAIASTTTALLGNATPSDGYGTPKSQTIAASINQQVKKYGRTTGQTQGLVIAINATVNVGYDTGVARFVGQIITTNISAGGDSGSLVVADAKGRTKADDRKPVGLLFAGSSSITVLNPIDAVLTRFGVTIDGE